MSLSKARQNSRSTSSEKTPSASVNYLDVIESDTNIDSFSEEDGGWDHSPKERLSPAAKFAGRSIGSIVLPFELQQTIIQLISRSDKSFLKADSARIFQSPPSSSNGGPKWLPITPPSHATHSTTMRYAARDGTAFASVALPPQYSAIRRVLAEITWRAGRDVEIERVMEWGGGTGAGLWGALHSFQRSVSEGEEEAIETKLEHTTVRMYDIFDKREGLVSLGKKLVEDVPHPNTTISWRKGYHLENDKIPRSQGYDAVALSAFSLSSLSSPLARKEAVKQMWESGAEYIVIMDHGNDAGFRAVAEAREYLLKVGRLEIEAKEEGEVWEDDSKRGSYVLAPCPHDKACPILVALTSPSKPSLTLRCAFSQRLQRPSFVRVTKQDGRGHEDVDYSYVVVRRGLRPESKAAGLGLERRQVDGETVTEMARAEWVEKEEADGSMVWSHAQQSVLEEHSSGSVDDGTASSSSSESVATAPNDTELDEALRVESYQWPRLIVPPLKRSGHIILDACTPEGAISRLTIPKSQGKQPFYDARKASWGDLFPHPPKNRPIVRYAGESKLKVSEGAGGAVGKKMKRGTTKDTEKQVMERVKDAKRDMRKSRRKARMRREADPDF
ncbi:hypothetical protein SISNIDRAFT_456089, partial [Sistotremastrum niveocremeum HHB9708]